jgi:hypothetical protein
LSALLLDVLFHDLQRGSSSFFLEHRLTSPQTKVYPEAMWLPRVFRYWIYPAPQQALRLGD